jgi:hypothetical protein
VPQRFLDKVNGQYACLEISLYLAPAWDVSYLPEPAQKSHEDHKPGRGGDIEKGRGN